MPTGVYLRTAEHRKKIGEANKKALLGNTNKKGTKCSAESCRNIGRAAKLRWQDSEYKKHMSKVHIGHRHSEEHKRKISESCKGHCGSTGDTLVVHHLDLVHGELEPDNTVTLTNSNHARLHGLLAGTKGAGFGKWKQGDMSLSDQRKKQCEILAQFTSLG